jgi:hypothetical protein
LPHADGNEVGYRIEEFRQLDCIVVLLCFGCETCSSPRMPLRARVDENKLPKMSSSETNSNDMQTNAAVPKTGIKVIIVGAGTTSLPPQNQSTF